MRYILSIWSGHSLLLCDDSLTSLLPIYALCYRLSILNGACALGTVVRTELPYWNASSSPEADVNTGISLPYVNLSTIPMTAAFPCCSSSPPLPGVMPAQLQV